ncbi:MAG TPA: hypothetical protein VNY24_08005 [Candidatus Acidoferrales bacterium]|jgi:hypothetical protein|nr:hypothetical protein [Candidatus Acidoferrales bacterium]
MNRKWILSALTAAMLSSTGVLKAQEPPPGPPPQDEFMPGGPFGGRMKILGFEEMHPGKVVSGAPYSAVGVTETTQTLADGTTINRKIQANIYRDGQGRVRRETTLPVIGPLVASGKSNSFVMIHDPVAGTAYILHPDTKIADQLPAHGHGGKHTGALQDKFEAHIQQEIANGTVKKEDLGTQTINGVAAQGTRYTHTIPVGQIGNDKPITAVTERWYSADLQVVVKSTRNDPRFGSTTYTLTSIQRQEPAATLFAVPSDYTVRQGFAHGKGKGNVMYGPAGQAPAGVPPPPGE